MKPKRFFSVEIRLVLLALLLAAAGCRDKSYDPLAVQWRLQPAKVLRVDAKIRDGLKVNSRLYQGTYTEVITYGLQARGQKAVTQDGETVTIEADLAELYVADNQALELTGDIDQGIWLLNHKAPVTVKSKNIRSLAVRNHKKDLRIEGVENVNVQNLAGNLEAGGCGGRFEAANVEGNLRLSSMLGSIEISNLTGDLAGKGIGGPVTIAGIDGNTTLTATGDVAILNAGLELGQGGGFTPGLKQRAQTERALGAQGKSIAIRTTGRARLENVNARSVAVEAFAGIELLNVFALKTEAAGAAQCRIHAVQSPLKLKGCRGGVIEGLEMEYEMADCAELMARPAGEPPPKGVLRGCLNVVFWDTPMGSVTQDRSRNVIFAQRETAEAAANP